MSSSYYNLLDFLMKTLISLILFLVALECNSTKVFLMGGAVANNQSQIYVGLAAATNKKAYPKNCSQDWKSTPCPLIAVITSAAETQSSGNDAYNIDQTGSLSYKSLFGLYGFSPKHISVHIDNYQRTADINQPEGQLNLQILKQADIIFFNGGDQSRHARAWLNNDGTPNKLAQVIFQRAINNQVILSGTSAGSMIMCSPIYGGGITYGHLYFASKYGLAPKQVSDGGVNGTGLTDTRNGTKGIQYEDNGAIMPGFNMVPFLSDTHFDNRGRLGRLIPALVQLKKDYGVGVDESTALYYDNGKGTVYGRNGGVFIADLTKATKNSKDYFSINNVLVTYITSGDSYNFDSKQVTVQKSKQLITKPYYNGFTDSSDIFGSYEITKLLTRLVDQTSSSNVGRSKVPSGYDRNAPIFKLSFQKTTDTQGYWSSTQRKYTAAHVSVYFSYQ